MMQLIVNNKTQAKFVEHIRKPLIEISDDIDRMLSLVDGHVHSFTLLGMCRR